MSNARPDSGQMTKDVRYLNGLQMTNGRSLPSPRDTTNTHLCGQAWLLVRERCRHLSDLSRSELECELPIQEVENRTQREGRSVCPLLCRVPG